MISASPVSRVAPKVRVAGERNLQREMFEILGELDTDVFDVESYAIRKDRDGFTVTGTIYAYEEIRPGRVDEVQRRLSEAAGAPVKMRVTIVPATLSEAGGASNERLVEPPPVVPSVEIEGLDEPIEDEAGEATPLDPTGK